MCQKVVADSAVQNFIEFINLLKYSPHSSALQLFPDGCVALEQLARSNTQCLERWRFTARMRESAMMWESREWLSEAKPCLLYSVSDDRYGDRARNLLYIIISYRLSTRRWKAQTMNARFWIPHTYKLKCDSKLFILIYLVKSHAVGQFIKVIVV
jgi:hypothetical protein